MKKLLRGLAVTAIWLLLWQVASTAVGRTLLLPSPLETLRALFSLAPQASFWLSIAASLGRVLSGFGLAVAVGSLLAVLTSLSPFLKDFFQAPLSIVKATPVASFIILALVWLSVGSIPVFTAFLIVLPIVWANVGAGIAAVDPQLLEMTRAFRLPFHIRFLRLYLPTVRPYFLAASATGMGMAWKAGIAAEVLCTPVYSIGAGLYAGKIYLETPGLFAWTVVVILLSLLLERLFLRLIAGERGGLHA